ncbi:MAG: DUF374 domain-containing protein [Moraxellaceae bacterium]|nr:DUF374 domain-containing protein [Moraxellaceae bacterium]MCC6199261.1 DUF374 domain-containing protein [Moraxellaceae bacterium]HQV42343.1 DUF374 domain-containing protein [Moraxellaceae bacterium]HQX89277.1 DUF374 domain-containing protein [Moraxellaceae bacterium]
MFRRHVAPVLVYVFYRLLLLTWRVSLDECPSFRQALKERKQVVIAHWHGDELALIHLARRYRIATITSTSKDGELMNRVLGWLGAETARGSSTRGGANAMRGLISHCRKNGNNVSFAVDGPKGPIYKVKPGVFEFSRLMNAPIYTASVGVSRPWIFLRAWNKAVLPTPFSRVHVRIAEGLPVIAREQDPRSVELAAALEALLIEGRTIVTTVTGETRP